MSGKDQILSLPFHSLKLMDWAQVNLTTHVCWLSTVYLTQNVKQKEREASFVYCLISLRDNKGICKKLTLNPDNKMLSEGEAEAVWMGSCLAKLIWSGEGQKTATLGGCLHQGNTAGAGLRRMALESNSQRLKSKNQDRVSLDHFLPGTLLKHQVLIKFLLGCWMGCHHGTGER